MCCTQKQEQKGGTRLATFFFLYKSGGYLAVFQMIQFFPSTCCPKKPNAKIADSNFY